MIRMIKPICEWAGVHGLSLGDLRVVPEGGPATCNSANCSGAPAVG